MDNDKDIILPKKYLRDCKVCHFSFIDWLKSSEEFKNHVKQICPKTYKDISKINIDDDVLEFTFLEQTQATINSITTNLTINNIEVNSVSVSIPFVINSGDIVRIEFDVALTDTEIILEGTYV